MARQATVKHALLANIMLSLLFASITAAAADRAVGGRSLASLIGEVASTKDAYSSSAADVATAAHQRQMLATLIPAEVNQTAATIKSTFNNATTAVSDRFNNATTGFTQLGQTSALDTAAKSKNASVGDYADAFVNDTNRALGVIGSVFKSSSEQSTLSQAFMIVTAAVTLMLGVMV